MSTVKVGALFGAEGGGWLRILNLSKFFLARKLKSLGIEAFSSSVDISYI